MITWVVFKILDTARKPVDSWRENRYWRGWQDQVRELGVVKAPNKKSALRSAQRRWPITKIYCQSVASLRVEGYELGGRPRNVLD